MGNTRFTHTLFISSFLVMHRQIHTHPQSFCPPDVDLMNGKLLGHLDIIKINIIKHTSLGQRRLQNRPPTQRPCFNHGTPFFKLTTCWSSWNSNKLYFVKVNDTVLRSQNSVRIISYIIWTNEVFVHNDTWINSTVDALFSRRCVAILVTLFIQCKASLLLFQHNISTRFLGGDNLAISMWFADVFLCVNVSLQLSQFLWNISNTSLPKSPFSHCIESTLTTATDNVFTAIEMYLI